MNPLQGIVRFNVDRKLESFNPAAEHAMLSEELQEFFKAYDNDDDYEMLDALCDIIVVATGAIYKMGYHPELALKQTVKEITSRKGSFNEELGKWQKDINQDPSTLYKADYKTARR
jgi:NTP pyrophosphatase (non-canonical NTP hydrolase)